MALELQHDPGEGKYFARIDGQEAHVLYEKAADGRLDFQHTFVPEELRGRGIAEDLVRQALEDARAQGLEVIPTCPFVHAFVKRHPELQDVAPLA